MRPDRDTYFLRMAKLVATRSTCLRRSVGCVLVNERGHVLATGYNGRAAGQYNCNEIYEVAVAKAGTAHGIERVERPYACAGAHSPSGTNLDACEAIHAEQNALLQCPDVYAIHTCYTTASPCITCTKLLMNTGCQRIVFAEEYPHPAAKKLWTRGWIHLIDKGEIVL